MFSRRGRRLALGAVAIVCLVGFLLWRVGPGGGTAPVAVFDPDLATYAAAGADAHVGERARVCGRVAEATYAAGVGGRPTFLNFGRPHPDAAFTAVIWGRDRSRFRAPPEDLFRGRRVCVAGEIRRHEGRPQIEVRSPAQIALEADVLRGTLRGSRARLSYLLRGGGSRGGRSVHPRSAGTMGILDDGSFSMTCPECGTDVPATVASVREGEQVACPDCGLTFSTGLLADAFEQAEAVLRHRRARSWEQLQA